MKHFTDADVDIDVFDRDDVLSIFPQHRRASQRKKDSVVLEKHNTGVYFQAIPYSAKDRKTTLDYNEAKEHGYFKLDFINNSLYKDVADEKHLDSLVSMEPDWSLFENIEFVKGLFHLGNHASLCVAMKPKSVEELSMLLAVIRPAKRHLQYKPWDEIAKTVWIKDTNDEYFFKKSHSISYAMAIVVQVNMLSTS